LDSDGGFAKGIIDLGGLKARQVTTFAKVWTTTQGGQDGLGATFFKPSPVPAGFRALGHYAQPNNRLLELILSTPAASLLSGCLTQHAQSTQDFGALTAFLLCISQLCNLQLDAYMVLNRQLSLPLTLS
jgi:hypothetical protein